MRIAYVETSFDQNLIVSELSRICIERGHDFTLILSSQKLKRFYTGICSNIRVLEPAKSAHSFVSRRSFLLERRTRFFPCLVRKYCDEDVRKLLEELALDAVLTYVGPEGLKYIFHSLCAEERMPSFYFLDQVQSGNRTLSRLPFSVGGCATNIMDFPKDHIPHIYRPRKKQRNIVQQLKYSRLRFLESALSTINRFAKKVIINNFLVKTSSVNRDEVILAPQGFTEASYTYSTLSLKTPVAQLFEFANNSSHHKFRWRLHPHNSARMSWSDLVIVLRSGYRIESPIISLEESIANCLYVTTLSSNIIYDSSLLGKPSLAIGRTYYCEQINVLQQLSQERISFLKSLSGFGEREWTTDSLNKMVKWLEKNG